MDKLKPVITHHFWLVFLLTLALPPVAWWMTSSALSSETEKREGELDGVIGGVSSGQGIPNDDWIKGVTGQIKIREEQNRLALDRLWQAQVGLMLWPPNVKQYMDICPYRGKLEDQRIGDILPDLYRNDYQNEVHRVWSLTEPVFDGSMTPAHGVPRKLLFPFSSMPQVPVTKWAQLPPTWEEIWNTQEDLWLLSELFKAVQRVNAPTTGIVDSYVKRITMVELFGGSRLGPDEVGSAGGGGDMPGMDGMPGMPGMPGGAGGRTLPGKGTSIQTKDAVFDLTEEYKVFGGAEGGAGMPGMPGSSTSMMPDAPGGGSGDAAGADPNVDENRYVASERAYRTRGFRLQVTIHQQQVPELIRELLNSKYPVEIIRFQQKALNPDEPGLSGPGGGGGVPGMARGGFPGAGGAGAMAGFPGGAGGADVPDGGADAAFDPSSFSGAGTDGGGAAAAGQEVSGVMIQTALRELDVVDFVVVGELYLYNPPIIDEDGDGVPDEPSEGDGTDTGDAGATVDATDPAALPGLPGANSNTAPGTVPGTAPAAPATGTTPLPGTVPVIPGAVPTIPGAVPATPENLPATPEIPGTVPGATPVPGTIPTPETPEPGTTPATPPATVPPATPPATEPASPAVPATPPATPPADSTPPDANTGETGTSE